MPWAEDVHRFWFDELSPLHWFSADPKVDAAIRERFGALHARLKARPPGPELLDAGTLVAGVVVLDQFSRHLFRRSPEAYASDAAALRLACHAVDAGVDRTLETRPRHFLYMPFMHGEDPATQARSVRLFAALGIAEQLGHAVRHKWIIDRFGRFPHRNAPLGRTSTAEEVEFLRTEPPFW